MDFSVNKHDSFCVLTALKLISWLNKTNISKMIQLNAETDENLMTAPYSVLYSSLKPL